ncbi:SMI1/KNR4 family protein [Streptomyces sp. NPDC051018]|uniref:SMI1/KNR4 family protein n=1 Tax=Streptomyces sp. NPDC051018 TaxID=3365639 RepID=UPI0037927B4F
MRPDLTQLRDLVEAEPGYRRVPAAAVPEAAIRGAEALVGPLPPSYRWWLAEFGRGRAGRADIASVVPPEFADDAHDAITTGWRLSGDRLCFAEEPDCGDSHFFALDRAGEAGEGEYPVVRRDGADGEEYPVAESFAGFLAVESARFRGLGDGPNPALARLWRSTPGVLLDNGVLVYGPHRIQERNESFAVARHAPHWVLIGDDGTGGGLFMRRHGRDRTRVYRLDPGAIGQDIEARGEPLTDDLFGWLRAGAPVSAPAAGEPPLEGAAARRPGRGPLHPAPRARGIRSPGERVTSPSPDLSGRSRRGA